MEVTPLRIRTQVNKKSYAISVNLDNLGHLEQFSQFEKDEESFIKFFNQLVKDSNNHELLQSLLKDKNLDSLHLLHHARIQRNC